MKDAGNSSVSYYLQWEAVKISGLKVRVKESVNQHPVFPDGLAHFKV
jgi:hypothetical protein